MSADDPFLSRWSKRKHQARKGEPLAAEAKPEATKPVAQAPLPAPEAPAIEARAQEPLPPVESLTPESDFTPFMKPDVDRGVRNQAMKALFKDPQFNVMDGLDVYIDDYSKPDPLPEGWLEELTKAARLGAYEPPKEPAEEVVEAAGDAAAGQPQETQDPEPGTPGEADPKERANRETDDVAQTSVMYTAPK